MKSGTNKIRTISSVCWTRNDDLPNMPYRCGTHLLSGIKEFDEVILVDWCSPGNKTFVQEYYDFIPKTGKIKSIQVTPESIQSLVTDPMKIVNVSGLIYNIGIRRATSDFILSTTSDIIAKRPNLNSLNTKTIYVNGRRGVPEEDYSKFNDADELRNYLFSNYKKYLNTPDVMSEDGQPVWDPGDVWSLVVCPGDFMLAHKNIWNSIRGHEQKNYVAEDTYTMKKAALEGYKSKKINIKAFHLNHPPAEHKNISKEEYMQHYYNNVIFSGKTKNPDNWGLPEIEFPIEVI